MSARIASPLAGSVWLLVLAFVGVFLGYGITHPGGSGSGTSANTVAYVAFLLAFSTVGALVASKRPRNPIGWLLLASVLCYMVGGLGVSLGEPAAAGSGLSPVLVVEWAGAWAWGVGVGVAVVTLLLFPEGRLPSRRWRPALWLAVAWMLAFVLGTGFGSPVIGDGPAPNPFAVGGPIGNVLAALQVAFPLVPLSALFAVASVLVRFRHARGAEREQVKWLLYAAALVGVGLLVQIPLSLVLPPADATNATNALLTGTLAALPVAIGIAVLRYRLYDIDVLVRRTVIYGATTLALAAAFFAGVLVVEALLSPFTRGNELAVAASTLACVALFQPVRRRVQAAVDRRFYRSRYDAALTVDIFSATLRDEVDLDAVRADLVDAVTQTVQPAHASVWLR
ncbi:MAG TPA: hypothetical protein VIN69_01755 [Candidatus Limnocylindria bacterium]